MYINTIEEALDDFRAGKFVIVVDDEDRENEDHPGEGELHAEAWSRCALLSDHGAALCGVGSDASGSEQHLDVRHSVHGDG